MGNNTSVDDLAAIEFLELFRPGGPWLLTAIEPKDRKDNPKIRTQSCNRDAASKFVGEWSGSYGLYFSVNPTIREEDKKAERANIRELAWLHVDLDPRTPDGNWDDGSKREYLAQEQERLRGIVLGDPPPGVPEPTCVIFSGGGFQLFWKLTEPMPINGEVEAFEEAKRYNKQLENIFDADGCSNVDRIMRLPGTVNIPKPSKVAQGRKPTETRLEFFDPDRVYPLSDFTQAAKAVPTNGVDETVAVSGEVKRLGNVDELDEWNVPERIKVTIVQGTDPDEPNRHPSRSEWLFDVLCQLYRSSVPDDTIYGIITDPNLGISASVVDKGGNAEKYALRQMTRAKAEADEPKLAELNARHAVIENYGGKCRVMESFYDHAMRRDRLSFQSFADFSNRYLNQTVVVGTNDKGHPVVKPVGKWWLSHPNRRGYRSLAFVPLRQLPDDIYNLWQGFAVDPMPGDCDLFLDHVFHNICNGDATLNDYLLNWMARAVQKPDTPGEVAVVLKGRQGTGKSFFAKHFGRLFGQHFLHLSNPGHLVGNFNAHQRDCIILFGDEAFYAGDKKHERILKTLITEDTMAIEAKGVDVEMFTNYTHLILASNDDWVVPTAMDDRRFFVLEVGEDQMQHGAYFGAVADQLRDGGQAALLHTLQNRDIGGFDVRKIPDTDIKTRQKIYSLGRLQKVVYELLNSGEAQPVCIDGSRVFVATRQLLERYGLDPKMETALSRKLARASHQKSSERLQRDGDQYRGYWLPSLGEARDLWSAAHKIDEVDWENNDRHWAEAEPDKEPF